MTHAIPAANSSSYQNRSGASRAINNKKIKNDRFEKLGLPSPKLNKRYRFSVLPTVCKLNAISCVRKHKIFINEFIFILILFKERRAEQQNRLGNPNTRRNFKAFKRHMSFTCDNIIGKFYASTGH
jgi:hypothetical protein